MTCPPISDLSFTIRSFIPVMYLLPPSSWFFPPPLPPSSIFRCEDKLIIFQKLDSLVTLLFVLAGYFPYCISIFLFVPLSIMVNGVFFLFIVTLL